MIRRPLRATLVVIGIVQLVLGAVFALAPAQFGATLGLAEAPPWVYWMFGMLSARSFGFAYGMFLAARDPARHIHWIQAMIGVQAVDWLATIYFVLAGAVTLAQVSTASFLPLIFIGMLIVCYPRQQAVTPSVHAQPHS
jgi:4-hydroxybenzoate polyprenyltransferase